MIKKIIVTEVKNKSTIDLKEEKINTDSSTKLSP